MIIKKELNKIDDEMIMNVVMMKEHEITLLVNFNS